MSSTLKRTWDHHYKCENDCTITELSHISNTHIYLGRRNNLQKLRKKKCKRAKNWSWLTHHFWLVANRSVDSPVGPCETENEWIWTFAHLLTRDDKWKMWEWEWKFKGSLWSSGQLLNDLWRLLKKIYLMLLQLDASGFLTRAINYQMFQNFHCILTLHDASHVDSERHHAATDQFTLQNLISAFKRVHRELTRLNFLMSKYFVLDFYLSEILRVLFCCHISSSMWIIH